MPTYQIVTTNPGTTQQILNATDWTEVSIKLNTAGPVMCGASESLGPINSGRGIFLTTTPRVFKVPPGGGLYVYSDAYDAVDVVITEQPYIEGNTNVLIAWLRNLVQSVFNRQAPSVPGRKC